MKNERKATQRAHKAPKRETSIAYPSTGAMHNSSTTWRAIGGGSWRICVRAASACINKQVSPVRCSSLDADGMRGDDVNIAEIEYRRCFITHARQADTR